jgi:hypothetical protein
MTSGTNVFAAQYVAIQNKAESMIGTGSGTLGYGQTVQSSDVFTGNTITKAQWDLIKFDIINIKFHQDGTIPPVVNVNFGDPIGFGPSSPNTNYDILLNDASAKRFLIAGSQSIVAAKASQTYSTPWSTQAQATLTVTFGDANQGRYFFNSGGKIRVTSSLVGAAVSPQITAWVNFLNSVGTQGFGADTDPAVNYYTMTNSYQTYYQNFLSSSYSANSYKLEARTNVSNNSTGTATQLEIRVTLLDSYIDPDTANPGPPTFAPDDVVNGTLTIAVSELKASGQLQPSGTFSITSPSYSLSSITAS